MDYLMGLVLSMGFLDGLFGGKRTVEQVRLSGLDSWFEDRLNSEASGLVERSEGVLGSINDLIVKLRADIEALGGAEYRDIDPRYDKIVRTAKPSYVKSMLKALDGLEFKGGGFEDIVAYERGLAGGLDIIGRVNFGDGKFLLFAFQDEMGAIQGGCKRLLDAEEKLKGILSSNREINTLTELKGKHVKYVELKRQARRIRTDAGFLRGKIDSSGARLRELRDELNRLHGSGEYGRLNELRERLLSTESEIKSINSRIHSALSQLKHGLRKYEKNTLDPAKVKLLRNIQDNPVEAFLTAGQGDVAAMLDGVAEASQSG
jgi:predicted  nucleic acid-binding Zn-ribbon protein